MRPRPHLEGQPAKTGLKAERLKLAERLIGTPGQRLVPSKMASGAKEAGKKSNASARAMAAKLDIMAKRRTDEEGQQPHP